jgi:Chromo (CHRromatin Organisation MOdifier) domain
LAQFAYNNGKHASTGETPFKLNYGRNPQVLKVHEQLQPNVKANQQANRWRDSLTNAQEKLQETKQRMEKTQNPRRRPEKDWSPGTKVYLSRKNIPTKRPSNKLDALRIGPFEIVEKVSRVTYKLRIPGSSRHPTFHVSLLEEAPETAPLAKEAEGLLEEEYEVEAIKDKRKRGRKIEYLVKWKDYPDDESSWEPRKHLLHSQRKVQEFEAMQETPTIEAKKTVDVKGKAKQRQEES